MSEYHKIQTLFKRDMSSPRKPLIEGAWTHAEFEYLANNIWTFTEKVDGTNIRVVVEPSGAVSFGGRTDAAQIPAQLITRLNSLFIPLGPRLAETFRDGAILYGEGYGAKIQKGGGNYRADQDFVLFDVRGGGAGGSSAPMWRALPPHSASMSCQSSALAHCTTRLRGLSAAFALRGVTLKPRVSSPDRASNCKRAAANE